MTMHDDGSMHDGSIGRPTWLDRFLARPAPLLAASVAIIATTVATVLIGAWVIYAFDDSEFRTYGEALWFTLQTATTVGYGDIAPQRAVGRVIAAVVMLVSLALLTVVTATITSWLVQRSRQAEDERKHAEVTAALDRLEAMVVGLRAELADARRTPVSGSDHGRSEQQHPDQRGDDAPGDSDDPPPA